ncbi:unnamed protein product [Parnassius mnemosyne]|uniref:BPTI/Kunitz inhibitor domain-containing protein n=1 Tax=Parnassius mnemosyne TaxID=213953 RepID=A0AAV1K9X9_9NEOP
MWLTIFLLSQTNNPVFSVYFNTYKEIPTRVTPYSPRVIDKTCLLKPESGPCRGNIPMYYYKPEKQDCLHFSWGGCQGNGNRFDTHEQCLESCLSKPNARRMRPKWCFLSFDYGFCFGAIKRWYYDARWKVCKETIYSGCGGNKNNFYNIEQCDSICRFGNGYIKKASESRGNLKKVLIVNPLNANRTS